MTEEQLKDSEECEQMMENGEDKDCFGCSCSICIAQATPDYEPYKEHLLEKFQILLEDIPHAFCSPDEIYGATKIINEVIQIVRKSR